MKSMNLTGVAALALLLPAFSAAYSGEGGNPCGGRSGNTLSTPARINLRTLLESGRKAARELVYGTEPPREGSREWADALGAAIRAKRAADAARGKKKLGPFVLKGSKPTAFDRIYEVRVGPAGGPALAGLHLRKGRRGVTQRQYTLILGDSSIAARPAEAGRPNRLRFSQWLIRRAPLSEGGGSVSLGASLRGDQGGAGRFLVALGPRGRIAFKTGETSGFVEIEGGAGAGSNGWTHAGGGFVGLRVGISH